ncbi:MAG: hypothetical protein AB6733_10690 [Clostridiaceae bacterium]
MYYVEIGIACTAFGALISFLTYRKSESKEVKEDGTKDGEIKATLAYISKGVDDIRIDIKANERRVTELAERVTRVEESAKSAHKRIDDMEP